MDERHHGIYFIPADRTDESVSPDFLDERVLGLFIAQLHPDVLAVHGGQQLVCECTGTEWMHNDEKRFIVRSAKLIWTN